MNGKKGCQTCCNWKGTETFRQSIPVFYVTGSESQSEFAESEIADRVFIERAGSSGCARQRPRAHLATAWPRDAMPCSWAHVLTHPSLPHAHDTATTVGHCRLCCRCSSCVSVPTNKYGANAECECGSSHFLRALSFSPRHGPLSPCRALESKQLCAGFALCAHEHLVRALPACPSHVQSIALLSLFPVSREHFVSVRFCQAAASRLPRLPNGIHSFFQLGLGAAKGRRRLQVSACRKRFRNVQQQLQQLSIALSQESLGDDTGTKARE